MHPIDLTLHLYDLSHQYHALERDDHLLKFRGSPIEMKLIKNKLRILNEKFMSIFLGKCNSRADMSRFSTELHNTFGTVCQVGNFFDVDKDKEETRFNDRVFNLFLDSNLRDTEEHFHLFRQILGSDDGIIEIEQYNEVSRWQSDTFMDLVEVATTYATKVFRKLQSIIIVQRQKFNRPLIE